MTISDEAVEAAANALDDAGYGIRSSNELQLALEAAAPSIRAQSLEEAAEELYVHGGLANSVWLRSRAAEMRQP